MSVVVANLVMEDIERALLTFHTLHEVVVDCMCVIPNATVWTTFIAAVTALPATFSLWWKRPRWATSLSGHIFDMREGRWRRTNTTGSCLLCTTGTRLILVQSCSAQMHNGYFVEDMQKEHSVLPD